MGLSLSSGAQVRADTTTIAGTTFDSLGFATGEINKYDGNTLFGTPAALCSTVSNIAFAVASKACPSQTDGPSFCYPADQACPDDRYVSVEAGAFSDYAMYAHPACTRLPLKPYLGGAQGRISYSYVAKKCGCFVSGAVVHADLRPNLDDGFCYKAPDISATADRLTYKPSEVDKPINLVAEVRLVNELLAGVDIRVEVIPSEGEPGVVTPMIGKTGDDKLFRATYTFPKFDKKRTDTLVFTCNICKGRQDVVKIDIKMSPTLLGFFNGVGNTEKQANDGLDALRVQTDPLRGKAAVKYDLFYNQTGSFNGSNVLQDLAEVFDQRSNELDGVLANRWESFWDVRAGRHSNPRSLTGQLLGQLVDSRRALADLLDATFNATLGQAVAGWARMLSNPPTAADMGSQLTKLRRRRLHPAAGGPFAGQFVRQRRRGRRAQRQTRCAGTRGACGPRLTHAAGPLFVSRY